GGRPAQGRRRCRLQGSRHFQSLCRRKLGLHDVIDRQPDAHRRCARAAPRRPCAGALRQGSVITMALSFSLSRRQAIVLAGSALAAAALPASLIFIERENGNLAGELVAALADPEGAAGIGRIWIASLEREVAAPVLAHKIAKRLRAHGWVPGDTPE